MEDVWCLGMSSQEGGALGPSCLDAIPENQPAMLWVWASVWQPAEGLLPTTSVSKAAHWVAWWRPCKLNGTWMLYPWESVKLRNQGMQGVAACGVIAQSPNPNCIAVLWWQRCGWCSITSMKKKLVSEWGWRSSVVRWHWILVSCQNRRPLLKLIFWSMCHGCLTEPQVLYWGVCLLSWEMWFL